MRDSKTARALRLATEKGYRVEPDGSVVSPTGRVRKLRLHSRRGEGSCSYYEFTISDSGISRPIAVHRLLAFQKFGEAYFVEGVLARHRNGNSLDNSWDNILIGTASQNMLDQAPEVRSSRAKHAASKTRRLTMEQARSLRADRARGLKYKDLCEKYGILKSTVADILSHRLYQDDHS